MCPSLLQTATIALITMKFSIIIAMQQSTAAITAGDCYMATGCLLVLSEL